GLAADPGQLVLFRNGRQDGGRLALDRWKMLLHEPSGRNDGGGYYDARRIYGKQLWRMDGERSRPDAGNKIGVYAWRRKGEDYDRKEKTEKNNGWDPCGCDRGGKCGNP